MKRLLAKLLLIVNLLSYDFIHAFDDSDNDIMVFKDRGLLENFNLSVIKPTCANSTEVHFLTTIPKARSLNLISKRETTQLDYSNIIIENRNLNFTNISIFHGGTYMKAVNQFTIFCSRLILKLNFDLKWSYFIFIYDSYSDLQRKALILLLKEMNVLLIPINFDSERKRLMDIFNHLYGSFNFITDCQESNLMKLLTLSQNSKHNVLNYPYHWIFINNNGYQNLQYFFGWKFAFIQASKDMAISNTDIFACISNYCDDENVCAATNIDNLIEHFKSDSNNRYKSSEDTVYYECELIFGTTYNPSYLNDFEEQYSLKGFEKDFIFELSHLLETSINRLKFSHKLVGYKYDNRDPWKILMISLAKKKMSMIMPLGFITPDVLANRFDLSRPVFEVIYGAVICRGDVGNSLNEYVKPFDRFVWVSIVFSIIFAAILLAVTYNYSPISLEDVEVPIGQPPSQRFTIGLSTFAMFCAFFSQDQGTSPRYPSGRMIVTVFFICSYLVMQGYSAVLISFIATGSAQLPFTDVQSLYLNKEYSIGTEKLFDVIGMLMNSNNQHVRGLAAKIMQNPNYNLISNHEEAIERVLNSSFVYIVALNSIEPYLLMNCKLTVAIPQVIKVTKHVVLQQNHPFTDTISQQIERLKSSGVVSRIYKKYYPKLPNTCDSKLTVVNPISLKTVLPMFSFLLLSMVISSLAVSLELFLRRKALEKAMKLDKHTVVQAKSSNVNVKRNRRGNSSLLYYRLYTIYKP